MTEFDAAVGRLAVVDAVRGAASRWGARVMRRRRAGPSPATGDPPTPSPGPAADGPEGEGAWRRAAKAVSGVYSFEIGADRTALCDDGLRALFGLPVAGPVDWDTCAVRLHPEDRARTEAAFARLRQEGGATSIELRGRSPDGTVRWLLIRAEGRPGSGSVAGIIMDITDRRADERRLRQAFESTTDSVLTLSPDWRFTFLNRRARDQIAQDRDVLGQVIWEAFPELGDGPMALAHRRCMAERVPTEVAYFCPRLCRLFAIRCFPSEDGGITAFFRDVTEERQAAARRAETEGLLRALCDASPELLFAKDRQGRLLYANPAALAVIGQTAAEAIGRTNEDWLTDPAHAAAMTESDRRIIAAGASEAVELAMFDVRRGEVRLYRSVKTPLRDPASGEVIGLAGVARDVTEERSAAERDARLAAIVTSSPDAMISLDVADGRIRSWNRSAERLFGYSEAEALNGPVNLLVPPELPDGHPDGMFPRVLRGELFQEYETVRMTKDGRRIPVAFTASRMFAPDGRVIGVAAMFRDIRARKATEAALARHRADLEHLVAERTSDLRRAHARLAQAEKLAALGQLAGGIAHDFNNVLQAVQVAAGLIDDRADRPADARRLALLIGEAAERGAAITRRLLAFSRRADLRAEPLDPAALLEDMREVLAHTLGGRIAVRVETAAGLPPLLADKGQLETVLVNLAANARDAMPRGGMITLAATVVLMAEPTGGDDASARLAAGRYVGITVTDTGTGMLPEVLARVSEPFFTTKPKGEGTGLGLAMARGFAEQSGGALEIESAPGRGTTVRLWFPVAGEAVHPPAKPRAADVCAAGRRHVLLVDDEPLVREIVAELLGDAGYAVRALPGAAEALDLLQTGEEADVLVTDLSMAGMDGLALIRAAQRLRPGLPAILLTGYADDAASRAADQATGESFCLLRKPVSGAQLADQVAALLRTAARA